MPTRISDLPEYTTITASAFMPIVDVNELIASKNKKIQITNLWDCSSEMRDGA